MITSKVRAIDVLLFFHLGITSQTPPASILLLIDKCVDKHLLEMPCVTRMVKYWSRHLQNLFVSFLQLNVVCCC